MIDKIKKFFQDARQEFRHVNWPTNAEGIRLTAIVIFICLGISLFLGVFDYLFSYALKTLIIK